MTTELCQAQAIPTREVGVAFLLVEGLVVGGNAVRLVMIDNYDSFTYNLAQLFYEFDLEVERSHPIGLEEIEARRPTDLYSPSQRSARGISRW
jgi:hypothetical protein